DDDFRHDFAELDRLDHALKLVASTEHCPVLWSRMKGEAYGQQTSLPFIEPRHKAMSTSRPNAPDEHPAWGEAWRVGRHVWIDGAGRAILGKGGLELLQGINRHHSISAAARHMGMSYRRAWELVQSINEGAGEPLVLAATGGVQGGGARLTPL